MIRFCDMEVYSVYERAIDRGQLFGFFCMKGHDGDIVTVYDDMNEFIGIITYDRLLSGNDELIQKEKLLINKDIWNNAKKVFNERKDIIYLPVFTEKFELSYFCYNDNSEEIYYSQIENAFEQFEQNSNCLFINELYPNVQVVYIYDMNEYAFRLYNLLKNKNINTKIFGKKWNAICGIDIEADNNPYPDYAKMNILAEPIELTHIKRDRTSKERFVTVNSFNFLLELIYVNRIYIQNIMKKQLKQLGVNFYLCRIPNFGDLQKYTLDEFYRNRLGITSVSKNLNTVNELIDTQIKKVQGKCFEFNSAVEFTDFNIMENLKFKSRKYSKGENYIYILGPCIVDEYLVNSNESLPYFIKKFIEEKYGDRFAIVTVFIPYLISFKYKDVIENLSIKENDIVLCIDEVVDSSLCYKYKINYEADINFIDLFNIRSDEEEWFFNKPIHTNKVGNMNIAKDLVDNYLLKIIDSMDFEKEQIWLQRSKEFLSEDNKKELYKYIKAISRFEINNNDKVGAIVMNCNPFTLGHQYLIDQAFKYVNYLYVFVVEENRSDFPFKDRIKLVKDATSVYKNIKVVPSGRFILSYETMPIYFEKAEKQNAVIDASKDIGIFARYIATELSITARIVGEEPMDNVTNQYNQEMRRSLSEFGIQFIEIPRIKTKAEVISASKVRKLLELNCWEEIEKLVPVETYNYLRNYSYKK